MNEVAYMTDHGEVKLTPDTVRKYLVSGQGKVTNQEVLYFLALCKYQALNPFLREAYLIKYSDNDPATIVVGKDTFTKRAAKAQQYDGAEAGVIVAIGAELKRRDGTLVLSEEKLIGGWAKVYRKDWQHPVSIEISLSEYEGHKRDGTPNRQWTRMPATMIRKVALVQALREAFPDRFQGMYDAAEMQQVDAEALPIEQIGLTPEKQEALEAVNTHGKEPEIETVPDTVTETANVGWDKTEKPDAPSATPAAVEKAMDDLRAAAGIKAGELDIF